MNPNMKRRDDGKALDVMQTQGRRDALTEVRDWVLGWIAGGAREFTPTHDNRKGA
jgi:hypothetical protein